MNRRSSQECNVHIISVSGVHKFYFLDALERFACKDERGLEYVFIAELREGEDSEYGRIRTGMLKLAQAVSMMCVVRWRAARGCQNGQCSNVVYRNG